MNATDQTASDVGVGSGELLEPKPIRRRMPRTLILAAALCAWDHPSLLPRLLRHEPSAPREKTAADHARLAAASEKRARKEAARKARANQTKGTNTAMSQPETDSKKP